MGKNVDIAKDRQKEMVKELLVAKGPRMIKLCMDFIEENFNNYEDKDARRDAHKLFAKWFDSQIPKTQIVETKNETRVISDKNFLDYLQDRSSKRRFAIDMEDAEIIDDEEARSIRSIGQ